MTIRKAFLEDRGVLRVAGEDAQSFLQGLLTNDVETLAVGAARYAALLSPQGKILFDFLVLRDSAEVGAAFLLDCAAAQTADLAKRLGFYRLRAKVTIADETPSRIVLALWDEDGFALDPSSLIGEGLHYVDPRDTRLGARAILSRDEAAALAANSGGDYEAHRIGLGVPKGGVDFAYADNFPHDANLDLLNGVDFEKGCYVGQEVVSRMRHRGGVRKRIVRLKLGATAPDRGAPVMAGEAVVGAVGSAAQGRALALLRIDRVEDARAAGRPLSVDGMSVSIEP